MEDALKELHAKADRMMAEYKVEHPGVDWDTTEVYAVIDNIAGRVDRISTMPKATYERIFGGEPR